MEVTTSSLHGPLENLIAGIPTHPHATIPGYGKDNKEPNKHITNAVLSLLKEWHYSVKVMLYPHTQTYLGLTHHRMRQIDMNREMPVWAEAPILTHEAVHAYIKNTENPHIYIKDRNEKELVTEACAYLILNHFGVNKQYKSRHYIYSIFEKNSERIPKVADKHWSTILTVADNFINSVQPYIIE